jgi:transposase
MRKREFNLNETERHELQRAYDRCKDGATKVRYLAVRLYGSGYAVSEIEAIVGCSHPSLMEWCRKYRTEGVAGLVDRRTGGNRAKLSAPQIEHLQQLLHQYTPRQWLGEAACRGAGSFWTVADLAQVVECEYGVCYKTKQSYYDLFAQCEFSRQRPGKQYKSRSEVKVMDFEAQLEKN